MLAHVLAGATAAAALASLRVLGVVPESPSEGTFWALQVRSGNTSVFEARMLVQREITVRLGPGRYVLVSFLRQCGENCETVEPPSSRCSAPFRIRRGQRLRAVVRYRGAACTIRFG
jgi:hypothetical protein